MCNRTDRLCPLRPAPSGAGYGAAGRFALPKRLDAGASLSAGAFNLVQNGTFCHDRL